MRNGSSVRGRGKIRCTECLNYFLPAGIGSHMRKHGKSYKAQKPVTPSNLVMSRQESGRLGGLAKAKRVSNGASGELRKGATTLARTLAAKVKRYRVQADKYILLGNTFEAALNALGDNV